MRSSMPIVGTTNIITDSPSQRTHQQAYYQQRYSRPSDNVSQWGGGVGGPILRDKLFFYGAFERYMYSNFGPGGFSSTVPSNAFLNGDLSALLDKKTSYGTDSAGN